MTQFNAFRSVRKLFRRRSPGRQLGAFLQLERLEDRTLLTFGAITLFPVPHTTPEGVPAITAGPDGNLWFTEDDDTAASNIGRITTSGVITEFPMPRTAGAKGITTGPDGALWIGEFDAEKVGRMSTTGAYSDFAIPFLSNIGGPISITTGSDGKLWFTELVRNTIGTISTSGVLTEYVLPQSSSNPAWITAGPDGNLWFVEQGPNMVGRMTTSGVLTQFSIPTTNSIPKGICVGPDGNLWFTENAKDKIGRITPSGVITEFSVPAGMSPYGITKGPDGNLWFTGSSENSTVSDVGEMSPTGTFLNQFIFPAGTGARGITAGPDGNIWFTERTGEAIGRIDLGGKVSTAGFRVGAPASAVAGTAFNVTITALNASGGTAVGYTGTVHFTSSDSAAVLPANYTFTAADKGVHTFTVTLKTAASQTLTATDQLTSTVTGKATIAVSAAAVNSLVVKGFPSPTTAGNAGSFTVTALDAFGNTVTNFADTIHLSSSDSAAALPANYTFTASDKGTHAFSATLQTTGTQTLTAADTLKSSVTGTQTGIVVNARVATSLSLTLPGITTAGAPFTVTVRVINPNGGTATSYTGTVHFVSSDPKAVLPADYTFTSADQGVHTFSGVVLKTAGTQTLTVTDVANSSITGKGTVSVSAASAVAFLVTGVPSRIFVGSTATFTVTAVDAYGNTATNYTGTVHFSSSDGKAILPANYTFVSSDSGRHTFSVVFETVGVQWLKATDLGNNSLTGMETGINVNGGTPGG